MTLVQQESIGWTHFVDAQQDAVRQSRHMGQCLTHLRENAKALPIPRAPRERVALDISGKANPRRQHDIRVVTGRVEPARAAVREQREVYHHSSPLI
jgi:hypothetical protein